MTEQTDGVTAEAIVAPETAAPSDVAAPSEAPSIADALSSAFEKTGVTEQPVEQPSDTGDGPARGPDGKFVAKEGTETPAEPQDAKPATGEAEKPAEPATDAPTRFSPDAKAEWANVPKSVKAETERAFKEMENGLNQYRDTVEPLKPFLELTNNDPKVLADAMGRYHAIDQLLAKDTIGGLDQICRNLGTSLQEVAAKVSGQTPDQTQQQQTEYVRGLEQQITELKQQVTGVTKTVEDGRLATVQQQIDQFAAQNPRYTELEPVMLQLITGGMAEDLASAYQMAERLNPAPATPPPPAKTAQTGKATFSVSGAPSSGSNPATRQSSGSANEALQRAFAATGLA